MPSKKGDNSKNKDVKEAIERLIEVFKKDENADKSASRLSHYRELPEEIQKAYDLLAQGATMIHGTATKYTLVGKISIDDQKNLASDLLRGCEIVGAATHVLLQDSTGCSRSVRHAAHRACLSILINVDHLVASFYDESAMNKNVGAQKTGAVWESCDTILKKLLPQGNRTAIRREIFTWTREIQDTMDEFQEMVDLGPAETGDDDVDEEEEDDFFGDEDQYSRLEMPVAVGCLALLKTSRGSMKISLETCEDLGTKFQESQDLGYLDNIQQLHEIARIIGEGATDFGSVMYPPILPASGDLENHMRKQAESIIKLQDLILGLDRLPKNIQDLAQTLRNAAEKRRTEVLEAIAKSKQ